MSTQSTFEPLPLSAATQIASISLVSPGGGLQVEEGQAIHRIRLVNFWQIPPGARVLEIGCGQGNCTAVLALAVGPQGHVDAVDPAPMDYGAPFTLAQAQAHLSESEIGDRITWHNRGVEDFLADTAAQNWDYVVFTHSIWYFNGEDVLRSMLTTLRGRVVGGLVIAEYALQASEPTAIPHLLAALARATLEAHNPNSTANIRCLLSPEGIKSIAEEVGWRLGSETRIIPEEPLLDGSWEVGSVKRKGFLEEVAKNVIEERVKTQLRSSRDSVVRAMDALNGKKPRTMDVWVAKFTEE